MNKYSKYLLHLYGEGPRPEDARDADDAEIRALREMKGILDDRPRLSPPESVIREVLASARPDSAPSRLRVDRRPARRASASRTLIGAGSAMLILMLAGLLFLWTIEDEAGTDSGQRAAVADVRSDGAAQTGPAERGPSPVEVNSVPEASTVQRAPSDATRETRSTPQSTSRSATMRPPVQLASTQASLPPPVESSLDGLSWDDSGDLRDVHRMIDVVQSRGHDIEWDEPAVPLELLGRPSNERRQSVRQATYPGGGRE
jgi:hypothetical protein